MILEGLALWFGAKWLKRRLVSSSAEFMPTDDPFVGLARKYRICHTDVHGETHTWDQVQDVRPVVVNYHHEEQHVHLHQHCHYERHKDE